MPTKLSLTNALSSLMIKTNIYTLRVNCPAFALMNFHTKRITEQVQETRTKTNVTVPHCPSFYFLKEAL